MAGISWNWNFRNLRRVLKRIRDNIEIGKAEGKLNEGKIISSSYSSNVLLIALSVLVIIIVEVVVVGLVKPFFLLFICFKFYKKNFCYS